MIGFQVRICCTNDIEKAISFSNFGEGRIRLVFLWTLLCFLVELDVVVLWFLRVQTGLNGVCFQKNKIVFYLVLTLLGWKGGILLELLLMVRRLVVDMMGRNFSKLATSGS